MTHKTVVSSALDGEIKCEFDVDLTAISCADFVDRVLDDLKIPVHHGSKLLHGDRLIKRCKGTVFSKFRFATDIIRRQVMFVEPCGGQSTPQRKKRRTVSDGSSPISVASSSPISVASPSSQGPQAPESSQSRSTVPLDMNAVNVSACVRAKLTKGFEARAV